jgi:hypothetical protein
VRSATAYCYRSADVRTAQKARRTHPGRELRQRSRALRGKAIARRVAISGCAARRVSSGASRSSYAADLRASWDPNPDASGGDTTICPTRTQRRAGHRPRRAVRARTIDSVRTTTQKQWSPAEQIR